MTMVEQNPFAQFAQDSQANPFAQFVSQEPQPPQGPPQADIEKAASLRREAAILPPMRADVRPSEEAAMLAAERERKTALGQAQLLEKGLTVGEAPGEARYQSAYGLNRLQGYKAALGPDFEVEQLQTEGPYKGEIIYRKKGEANWQTVRDPEGFMKPLDFAARGRDIQSILPTAVPEVAGALGGMGGAALRTNIPVLRFPALMAAAGGGATRFAAEMLRLRQGRARGIIPPDISDAELQVAAFNESWPQALGEGAGVALHRLLKTAAVRGMPNLGDITPSQFEAAVQEARSRAGSLGQGTLTVGDVFAVMSDPAFAQQNNINSATARSLASFFKSAEAKIASTADLPKQREFQERAVAREQAAGETIQREIPEAAGGVAPDMQAIGQAVERAAPGIEETQAMMRAVAPTRPAADLGERITQTIRTAERSEQDAVKKVYQQISGEAAATTQPASSTADVLDELSADFRTRILPSLTEDNRKLVGEAVRSLYRETPGGLGLDYEFIPAKTELKEITFDQYSKAISDLRTAIRKAYRGDWSGEIDQLARLEEGLVADRNALLAKTGRGQQAVADLERADADWARLKTTFRRAKIADAFTVSPKRARSETAEEFLDDLSIDADTARAVAPYLQGREREEVRGMLMLQMSELAKAYGMGRKIRQGVLERAIDAPDSAITVFFTPAERNQLRSAAQLQEIRRAVGIPADGTLSSWFDGFYEKKSIEQADAVFRRLALDPRNAGVADAIRGMMRKRVYDDITKTGEQGAARIVDTDKLRKMLEDPKQAQWLAKSLGPDFGARLRLVGEATATMFPDVARLSTGAEPVGGGAGLELARRAGRVVVGVLSPESRALTYALQTARGEMRDRISRAILDPEYFQRIMTRSRDTPGARSRAAAIGAVLNEPDIGDPSGKTWAHDLPAVWSENASRMIGAMR